jgi:hypothetical protein
MWPSKKSSLENAASTASRPTGERPQLTELERDFRAFRRDVERLLNCAPNVPFGPRRNSSDQ